MVRTIRIEDDVYEGWLLYILWKAFDGKATKSEATKAVIRAMQSQNLLVKADFDIVTTGETKAENTIAWGRNRLKESGLIKADSLRGVWELTAEGIEKVKRFNPTIGQ